MGKNKHLMVSLIVIVVVSLDIWLKTIALGIVMPQQPNLTKDQLIAMISKINIVGGSKSVRIYL